MAEQNRNFILFVLLKLKQYNDILNNPEEIKKGSWFKGKDGGIDEAYFYRKGDEILVLNKNGDFITSLHVQPDRVPIENVDWKNATPTR